MRVLIVNTSENTGGAAVAANRLMEALNHSGIKAKMLVRDKNTHALTVVRLPHPRIGWLRFAWERFLILLSLRMSRKHLYEVDTAWCGKDITSLQEFREADVIHLHWVNQGMLSLRDLRAILHSGKPVVWTMHDFWPATGICHYPHDCEAFLGKCHNCQYLSGGGSASDLSSRIWKQKADILSRYRVTFVTCSQWLRSRVENSRLLRNQQVLSIPNTIDTHLYRPADKKSVRCRLNLPSDRKLILFVSQKITDPRKGVGYFLEACRILASSAPDAGERYGVIILGGNADRFRDMLPLPVYPIGYVSNQQRIIDVYNCADLFVLPSLEDNLPNTIMEAMACGVPCVGFNTGGIPEMIDHRQNGYVAHERDAADLYEGMRYVLDNEDYQSLSRAAVGKVHSSYSQDSVARRYIEAYENACRPILRKKSR